MQRKHLFAQEANRQKRLRKPLSARPGPKLGVGNSIQISLGDNGDLTTWTIINISKGIHW